VTAWPPGPATRAIWASPWLRGLDAGARGAIEAAGRVRSLAKGAHVYALGEAADAIFVVGEGLVDVRAVRRGEQEARAIRRAVAGDALGEEAMVCAGVARTTEARCVTPVVVAEVPVGVFRRASERAGRAGGAQAAAMQEALMRAAARDVLRASSLGRMLTEGDVEALVASAEHRSLARGEVLFACGEPATRAYVVADGMVQVQDGGDERPRIRAYLSRGDLVADGALDDAMPRPGGGSVHDVTVSASGPAWLIALPHEPMMRIARRSPAAFAEARRLVGAAALPAATRHVLGDLWRFAEAGSMLVIDDEACVRCGHCVASCADAHADGVSRLVRRGEKVVVRDAVDGAERALLLPGSCQHCKHPACMMDCPTGAIGRDLAGGRAGDVFVRDDLCVGCGRCVTACPWGSVQMAPRAGPSRKRHLPVVSALSAATDARSPSPSSASSVEVAVKCDMCRDLGHGPACVSACPVDAIARIDPLAALADVRDALAVRPPRRGLPARRAAWPWVLGAAATSAALGCVQASSGAMRWATGIAAGGVIAALAAYALVKRTRLGRGRSEVSRVRPHAIAHMALGTLALGLVGAHAGAHVTGNAAGALVAAFALASFTGIGSALVYRLVPRALSRVERRAYLPEDLAAKARELDDRAFGALTGRSEATKAVYVRWLAPYARAPLGALWLIARGRKLRAEEKRLRAAVESVLGTRTPTLDGLEDLIRMAVERRALRAQTVLQMVLRVVLPAHVVVVAATVALLVVHVVLVARGR
jgi:Fe-S-cluster-containing dehydrogenase component/CRP-like cAMP-binding protein